MARPKFARHYLRRLPLAAALLAGLVVPASAGAVTMGPPIDQIPANNANGPVCADVPPGFLVVPGVQPPTGSGSCQFTYSGADPSNPTDSLVSPGNGIVTNVRVKVGNITGPMRINIQRTLYKNTIYVGRPQISGPFHQAFGPVFTPAPNSITTVPVNLPVVAGPTPNQYDLETIAPFDWVALEVLAPNVPAPVFVHPGLIANSMVYPGPTAGGASGLTGLRQYNTGLRVAPLIQAEIIPASVAAPSPITPVPGVPTSPVPGGVPTPQPAVALSRSRANVRNNRATLPLLCSVVDCSGLIRLQTPASGGTKAQKLGSASVASAAKKKSKKKAKKPKSLGTKKFSIKAGEKDFVKVKLNKRGRALMRKKKTATVEALVTYEGGATATMKVKLKRK